ncbi:hypothetical protein PMAYCL1PPCAC_31351, partial [Pristionchus mayeri]
MNDWLFGPGLGIRDYILVQKLKRKMKEGEAKTFILHVKRSFEAAAVIAEVFRFEPIDRTKCKKEYNGYLRDKEKDEQWKVVEALEIDLHDARNYVKPLEAKVNYLRTIVSVLESAMQSQLQSLYLCTSAAEVTVSKSDVKTILADLPPPYLYAVDMDLSNWAA